MENLEIVEQDIEQYEQDEKAVKTARDIFVNRGNIDEGLIPIGYRDRFRTEILEAIDNILDLISFLKEERECDREIVSSYEVWNIK